MVPWSLSGHPWTIPARRRGLCRAPQEWPVVALGSPRSAPRGPDRLPPRGPRVTPFRPIPAKIMDSHEEPLQGLSQGLEFNTAICCE